MRVILVVLLASLALAQDPPEGGGDPPRDVHGLRPSVGRGEIGRRARAAQRRGYSFLTGHQNSDGSWGSHDPLVANLKDFGFRTGNAGSQDGVRIACTAICAQALLEAPERTEAMQAALDKALEVLLEPHTFGYHPGESFNTWGYGYHLDFLTRFLQTPEGRPHRERALAAAQRALAGLRRFQLHEGGWGYYSGPKLDFESTSFNTGTFVGALQRAREVGLDVPAGMIEDASKLLVKMRVPDGSFVYSSGHIHSSRIALLNLGAGSRTCAVAHGLHAVGLYDDEDLKLSLAVFTTGENYLEDGRKLIVPHSAVHLISGYFFFYGYNYASEIATVLGDEVELETWDRLAWTMLRTQEGDGGWWDTAAADYGDKWGTGFAILTLGRYLKELERRGVAGEASDAAREAIERATEGDGR